MSALDLFQRNFFITAHRDMVVAVLAVAAVASGIAACAHADDLQTAENVLVYQRETGGWPKNYDRKQELTDEQRKKVLQDRSKNDSMIDNGATHTEIRLLAGAYEKTQDNRFKQAAMRGIQFLLDGQYDNGGWPQQFPSPRGYARYITFNDNAMIGVMSLLSDATEGKDAFKCLPDALRQQCGQAVQRGIACIIKCQIKVDGRLTVWCAQHDHITFEPRKARSYDIHTNLPIFCSRDGVPKRTLAEISYERRNGYSWLGYYAQGLLQDECRVGSVASSEISVKR